MELSQSWSEDPAQAAIGEPVTQTMTIQAEGLMKSQLPTLSELQKISLASSDIKIYPDQPVLTQAGSTNGVISRREEKMAMIPGKSGTFNLPAIEVPWWNTQADRMEIATIDATAMHVKASINKTPASTSGQSPFEPNINQDSATEFNIRSEYQSSNNFWKWVSFGLGLGWLLTSVILGSVLFSRKKQTIIHQQSDNKSETKSQRNRAGRRLKQACLNGRPGDAREFLLIWAQGRWPDNPPANLATIGKRIPALHDVIEQLEQALYNDSENQWDGNAFWEQFKAHRRDNNEQPGNTETQLEPLFKV